MKHRIIIDWFDRLNKALNEKLGPADWEWRFCGAVLKWNGSGDGGQYIAAVRVRPDCWTDRAAIELLPEDVARLIGEPSEGARFSLDHCWLAVAKN